MLKWSSKYKRYFPDVKMVKKRKVMKSKKAAMKGTVKKTNPKSTSSPDEKKTVMKLNKQ